jgi:hypothetical protein
LGLGVSIYIAKSHGLPGFATSVVGPSREKRVQAALEGQRMAKGVAVKGFSVR